MKKLLLWVVLPVFALFVAVVSLVSVRASEVEPLPPPDAAMLIELGDGSRLPLAEVLDRAERGLPLPVAAPIAPLLVTDLPANAITLDTDRGPFPLVNGVPFVDPDPVYALAQQARHDGRYEEAIALYLSIPRDSDRYARARRIVAWNILTNALDQPERAVVYANQAMHADPLDGNVWQDWARVYGRTLGLPVD